MSAFTPSTIVYLVDSPVNDYKNQLNFASAAAQATYFLSKLKHSYTNFTYQRKDTFIRIPANIETLYDCNYVMYQNSNYGSKWFYCFIKKLEFVNPNTTNVYIETDVFQTWQFAITFLPSFVAREHVADDTVWKHTLPEPLSKPEYIYTQLYSKVYDTSTGSQTNWIYCVYATPASGTDEVRPAVDISGSYQDYTPLYKIGHMKSSGFLFGSPDSEIFKELIEFLISKNYEISYTITMPAEFVQELLAVKWNGTFDSTVYNFKIYSDFVATSGEINNISLAAINTTTINGHTVRNKKCNCFPFRYLQLTDDIEQNAVCKYELFSSVTHDSQDSWQNAFAYHKTPGSDASVIMYPNYYQGKTTNFEHSITLSSFPPVPYSVDYFKQYLALHKSSFVTENIRQAIETGANAGFGVASAGQFGAVHSVLDYMSTSAKYSDLAKRPPIVHNAPSGESKFCINGLRLKIYDVIPTAEYIAKIDSFFDKYGYNVSITKTPQFTSRLNWNYIETKEIEIQGDIPKEDIDILKNMFNSGCTIWHNPATFGDYSQPNTII